MTANTLDKLERFLRTVPLPRGWKWEEIGLDPRLGESGIIVLSLGNSRKKILKIALFERDESAPCYTKTTSFNITALRGEGAALKPEEMDVVERVARAVGVFDRGGFIYPRAEKPDVISAPEEHTQDGPPPMSVIREYSFVKDGRRDRSVVLVLPSLCDWKCVFCKAHSETPEDILPERDAELLNEVEKRAPEWAKAGLTSLSITGSEPLNNGIFTELVNFLSETLSDSCLLIAQTTGVKLHDKNFVSRIQRAERILFDLPLYGPDAESHDEVTGEAGSFDAVAGLLRDSPLKFKAHTILLQKNIARLREIRALCSGFGRGHAFTVFYAAGDRDIFAANAPRLTEAVAAVREIANCAEFAEFAFNHRERIPPCVTNIQPANETTEIFCRGADGGETKSPIWDKINPDLIPCVQRNDCSFGANCPGVYSAYVSLYGWSEFKPM